MPVPAYRWRNNTGCAIGRAIGSIGYRSAKTRSNFEVVH
jgi:hypothetical protein